MPVQTQTSDRFFSVNAPHLQYVLPVCHDDYIIAIQLRGLNLCQSTIIIFSF